MAASIHQSFQSPGTREVLQKLKASGVKMEKETKKPISKRMANQTVVFTGELSRFTRQEAQELVRSHGGDVGSDVTKQTTFVVAGDSPGSKVEKAKALGVKIIDEAAFKKLVKGE
jgi:DNA ligase (NAD+)